MAITLRGGKELKGNKEAEKKHTEVEIEKADYNSASGEKNQSRNGPSNKA